MNATCILFVNDIKILSIFSKIEELCLLNKMKLNIGKRAFMIFHGTSEPIFFKYSLCNSKLCWNTSISDLSVVLISNLNPESHLTNSWNARFCPTVLKGGTKHGGNEEGICCSCQTYTEIQLWLQAIKDRFTRTICTSLGFKYLTIPIMFIEDILWLASFAARRQHHDLVLLYKIVTGEIDWPDLIYTIFSPSFKSYSISEHLFITSALRTIF